MGIGFAYCIVIHKAGVRRQESLNDKLLSQLRPEKDEERVLQLNFKG